MAIRRRGKAWLVTVELGRDPLTGVRRRVHMTVATRREAEREEARLRHEVDTGLDIAPARVTLADYLKHWLGTVRPNVAPATFLRYEGLLRCQVVPHLGSIPLAKLRPLHVQHLYAWLQRSGRVKGGGPLSARTLLHVHRVLGEALGQAVRWQIIPRNVCEAVQAPQPRRAEVSALSPDGVRALLDAAMAEDSAYGDAIILAVHTGLRQGELLGMRWEDIDMERGCLSVRRSLQHLPGEEVSFRQPKTARSRRTIPVGAAALVTLRRIRQRQLEKKLRRGASYRDSGLVFTTSLGTPLDCHNLIRTFRRVTQGAGLGALRFHDLRHTHASLMLTRGVHPKVVSERLGHASITITLDTYSHVLPSLQEEAVRDLDAWLAGHG